MLLLKTSVAMDIPLEHPDKAEDPCRQYNVAICWPPLSLPVPLLLRSVACEVMII